MSGLRGRLLAAFFSVALPPVAVLAYVTGSLVLEPARDATEQKLAGALAGDAERLKALAARLRADLAEISPRTDGREATPELAEELGRGHDLPLLDLVGPDGRVLSSRHWPAGFGLPPEDGNLGADLYRVRVAAGHGAEWRLGLVVAVPARLGGQAISLRGGVLVDEPGRLSALLAWPGVEAGLLDGERWLAREGSPLLGWAALPQTPRGEQGGQAWTARSLAPGVRLVVAASTAERDAVLSRARRTALVTAATTVLLALVLGVVLSGRIARPLAALSGEAGRVAAGDLAPGPLLTGPAEVAELGAAFDAMRAELRASRVRLAQAERVAAWRELARRLAHDLKNPLFPIQVSIETVRRAAERQPGGLPGSFRELLDESTGTVLTELRSLRRIVDEFSEFARLSGPRPRPTNLADLARHTAGLYTGQAEAAGVVLEVEAPDLPPVSADPDLLARALGNLVKNAIEAVPAGGRVRIGVRQPGEAILEVSDDGPGLTELERERIFTPYVTSKPGGTGLGLAIVQGIVTDHGGRVEVDSQPGAGSTFRIVLPARASGPPG